MPVQNARMTLAKALRKVREQSGLTQTALAGHLAGTTQSTISKWENDDSEGTPSLAEIARIEDACERPRGTVYRLMGLVHDPKTTADAILADPFLSPRQAQFLTRIYEDLIAEEEASATKARPAARNTRRK